MDSANLSCFCMGTSFILMKRGLESFSEIQVGSIRIFVASLTLMPFIFKRLKKVKKKDLIWLALVGFFGNLIPAWLFAKAQTQVNSALAGMLNTTFPIIALIIGTAFFGMKTPRHKIIGIIVGLGGSIGIVLSDTNDLTGTNNIFALFVIGAVIMYAFSINIIKFKLADLDGITITVIAFSMIGWVAGISIFFTDFEPVLATPDWQMNLLYICILGIAGSSIAVAFFYILLDYVTVVFGSLITYIIPLFAVFWGLFDGESVTWVQILFMAVVLFGVWLVNKKKQKLPGKSSDSK
jgi:drug/metabolite transporter (DMT)-like permease